METWGWLVAYVVGFGLLQLLLYRYFQRDDPSVDATPGPVEQSAPLAVEDEPEGDEDGVHCRNCGTYNEPDSMFSYCKECVEPLR